MKKRLVALFLTICLLLAVFASCDQITLDQLLGESESQTDEDNESSTSGTAESTSAIQTTTSSVSETTDLPSIETTETPSTETTETPSTEGTDTPPDEYIPGTSQKNYGTSFNLLISGCNPESYYWADDQSSDTLSNALYLRQAYIKNMLGVDFYATGVGAEEYLDTLKYAVRNKDGCVDAALTDSFWGNDGLIRSNYLTDFNDIPEINLDADYWNRNLMNDVAINGHMYLGYSDFNIPNTNVITFNKELLEKYEDQLDESVYSMVENYRWTLDKMMWLASLVYVDYTADGKTNDDQFGFSVNIGSQGYAGLLQACGIQLIEQDTHGKYKLSIYNEKNKANMKSLVDKLYQFVRSDYAWVNYDAIGMSSNRVLMTIESTYSISELCNDVDFGILPYPMYDTAQKDIGYRSVQWAGYICVPAYLENAEMMGDTLELLALCSDPVKNAFYEQMLGSSSIASDVEMLDIVWKSVCADAGMAYFDVISGTALPYVLRDLTKEITTQNLASYVASKESLINKNFEKHINNIK